MSDICKDRKNSNLDIMKKTTSSNLWRDMNQVKQKNYMHVNLSDIYVSMSGASVHVTQTSQ